jgi:DNA-binding HxlR family transcriptional regulator
MEPPEWTLVEQVERLMSVLGAKWKPAIMFVLVRHGPVRFNELRRSIPGVSQKMLTERLRELERDGLVKRTLYAEIPARVEYTVTTMGRELDPIYKSICAWGQGRRRDIDAANERFDRKK